MKEKIPNTLLVWKQIDDELVARLRLSVSDRAAYCYLLRHSRLEGQSELWFSVPWLARGIRMSAGATRQAVRRLLEKGALRLVQRTKAGHVAEVRLPDEIPAAAEINFLRLLRENDLEEVDFFQDEELREAIHAREGGRCFFCLRRVTAAGRCLDHVVPQVQMGRNTYRNLVSCCLECNSLKGERGAGDFLRWLFREGKLTTAELKGQLRALEALGAGKLKPEIGARKLSRGGNEVRKERSKEYVIRPDTLAASATLHVNANSTPVPGEACSITRARNELGFAIRKKAGPWPRSR